MLDYDKFPTFHMRGAVQRWVENAIPPGSFLTAVLKNDLKEAAGRADNMNRAVLPEIIQWFYNEAPSQCWGSPEAVDNWSGTNAPDQS